MDRLRVAYAGHDLFSSCLAMLAERPDVHLALCLTSEPGGQSTEQVVRLAHRSRTPVLFGRPNRAAIEAVDAAAIDLLICAGYSYRVPIGDLRVGRAVNIHPTLLPEGRGPNPLPYLLDRHPEFCGITIHEIVHEFDRGPVLLQEPLKPDEGDGFDELFLKLFAAAPRLLSRFLDDIDGYSAGRREQDAGSYWPDPPDEWRTVVAATARAADVTRIHSLCGVIGTIVRMADGTCVEVTRLTASRCEHGYPPGSVVARLKIGWIVAVTDGLIRLDSPRPLSDEATIPA